MSEGKAADRGYWQCPSTGSRASITTVQAATSAMPMSGSTALALLEELVATASIVGQP
jgi:hypothetical protein